MFNNKTFHSWRKDFLKEIGNLFPFIKGSLVEVRKPCIRSNCSACGKGNKHPAFLLTFRKKGKTHCRYIPKEWVSDFRQAILNGRKLEQSLALACEELLWQYRQKRHKKEQK